MTIPAAMMPMVSVEPMVAMISMVTVKAMMAAAVIAVVSVMTTTVASVSRFGDDRHGQHRHQRDHEYEYAFHCDSLSVVLDVSGMQFRRRGECDDIPATAFRSG